MLKKIIQYKKDELTSIKFNTPLPEIKRRARDIHGIRNFQGAISRIDGDLKTVKIIGEIKKASPSSGLIREDFDPVNIAGIYEKSGISAISVLTDKEFFQGDIEYLPLVKKTVQIPVLRKDFIFDEYHIYESLARGADAVLLIAAILETNQLIDYIYLCNELKLHTLIEIHNTADMEKILHAEKILSVIGINNRDLETFKVDINVTMELISELPRDKTIVSESGIKDKDDIIRLMDSGVSAFLIGETFMKESDISKKVKELKE